MFEEVLYKQYTDFWNSEKKYVPRAIVNNVLSSNISYLIIGPRRAGKSTLLYNICDEFVKKGKKKEEFIYVDFNNVNLINFSYTNFDEILSVFESKYPDKKPIILLDEIQNIKYWEKYVRNLVDNQYRVFVTGSNSEMLSLNSKTMIGARLIPLLVFPVNFNEYLYFKGVDSSKLKLMKQTKLQNLFDEYMNYGGFPEVILSENKVEILNNYLNLAINDIIKKYSESNESELKLLIKKVYENICNEASVKSYFTFFENLEYKIDKNKLYRYFTYLSENYLVLSNMNHKTSTLKTSYLKKNYFVDLGYLKLFDINSSIKSKLENLVFLELKQAKKSIYYYKNGVECDFVVCDKYVTEECIQVTSEFNDTSKDREINGLIKSLDYYKLKSGTILTYNQEETIKIDKKTIYVKPVWKWLLEKK